MGPLFGHSLSEVTGKGNALVGGTVLREGYDYFVPVTPRGSL